GVFAEPHRRIDAVVVLGARLAAQRRRAGALAVLAERHAELPGVDLLLAVDGRAVERVGEEGEAIGDDVLALLRLLARTGANGAVLVGDRARGCALDEARETVDLLRPRLARTAAAVAAQWAAVAIGVHDTGRPDVAGGALVDARTRRWAQVMVSETRRRAVRGALRVRDRGHARARRRDRPVQVRGRVHRVAVDARQQEPLHLLRVTEGERPEHAGVVPEHRLRELVAAPLAVAE